MSEARAFNRAYTTERHDLLALLSRSSGGARVLDVGCADGANGRALKRVDAAIHVTGIELDQGMAARSRELLDRVCEGDASTQLAQLAREQERYDVVLMGDVLEHLVDPWGALALVRRLCPRGEVIVSLPNIAHWSTLYTLAVRQHWPYAERGLQDRTHLRFFARRNLEELCGGAGFRIDAIRTRYRITEAPSAINRVSEPLLSRLPGVRRPFAYQFLCRLR